MSTRVRIPFWQPQTGATERRLVEQVLDSNYLNDGEVTLRFEQRLAELLNVKHVVTTTSGTSALFAALVAAGIKSGDEILVPDITFIATANAVTMAGATPVLVDVDPDSLTISPQAAALAVTERTRAIVPVHVSGRAADMDAILGLAMRHDLAVIEDAAEAFMSRATHKGDYLGTIGDAGCFSFSPNKIITTGQGGCVVTNDDDLAARVRELKDQGRTSRGTGGADVHPTVGYNFKFTNLQAAVGLGQLDQLDARSQRLREIYDRYVTGLRDIEDVRLFGFADGELPLWSDVLVEERDALDRYLLTRGMQGRRYWRPLHAQAPYRRDDAEFPVAAARARDSFWLPSAFTMSDSDVAEVCDAVKDFFCTGRQVWVEAA
jgi:perosamine synthetase